jgi:hypothetical protein
MMKPALKRDAGSGNELDLPLPSIRTSTSSRPAEENFVSEKITSLVRFQLTSFPHVIQSSAQLPSGKKTFFISSAINS